MELPFEYDRERTALVVEVSGFNTKLLDLPHNKCFQSWQESEPLTDEDGSADETEPPTPSDIGIHESKGYLVLPYTKEYKARGYLFGRSKSQVDIQLPQSQNRAVRSVHFKVHLSKYMTWMIQVLSSKVIFNGTTIRRPTSRSLHPEQPNHIQVGDVNLNIHVAVQNVASLQYGSTPTHISPELLSRSSTHSSISSGLIDEDFVDIEGGSGYHICLKRPIGNRSYEAVCVSTGRHCVVKMLDYGMELRARDQYLAVYTVSNLSGNIVSYLKYVSENDIGGIPDMIVTEFLNGVTLQELRHNSIISPESVHLMYGQMVEALCFLKEAGIVHGDIRSSKIIVSTSPLGKIEVAKLGGFSCYSKFSTSQSQDAKAGFSSDFFSLNYIHYICLLESGSPQFYDEGSGSMESTSSVKSLNEEQSLKGDLNMASLIRSGVLANPDERQTVEEVRKTLWDWIGNRVEVPIRHFLVLRTRKIVSVVRDRQNLVRISDFVDALYCKNGVLDQEVDRFLRRIEIIDNEHYCSRRAALKFCYRYGLTNYLAHLKVAPKAGSSTLPEPEIHRVSYHSAAMMINITQMLRVAGYLATTSCLKDFHASDYQEVRGDPRWEGLYVNLTEFERIAKYLRSNCDCKWKSSEILQISNRLLASRFSSTPTKDAITLLTSRISPHMLQLRREDYAVNWAPGSADNSFIPYEASLTRCDEIGFSELKQTLELLHHESRQAIVEQHENGDDGSPTSVESSSSFREMEQDSANDSSENELRFRLRR